jgi:hypothetical protein
MSTDSPHLCLMSKKEEEEEEEEKKKKKKKKKKEEEEEEEEDIEIKVSYPLDHLSDKDKLIFMKLVEKNDELER